MKKESRKQLREYTTALKSIQKVIKLLADNDVYFYAASYHTEASIMVKSDIDLATIFNVVKVEVVDELIYTFVDVEGDTIKIVK